MIKRLKIYVQNPQYLSVGLVFSILGILIAFWVTRLPYIKNTLNLTDGELGLSLFFIVAMMFTSRMINRWGEGKATLFSTFLLAASFILPFVVPSFVLLCIALFLVGAMMGVMDVSMNALAGHFEKKHETIIMSTCHGFFSLGAMLGASTGSIFIGMGISPISQMLTSIAVIVLLLFGFTYKQLKGEKSMITTTDELRFEIPKKPVIGLAIIGFCIMVCEGAVTDWSTVYLQDFLFSDPFLVGFGYAGFSLFMTIGRFNGDYIISLFSETGIMLYGSIISLFGIILVLLANTYLAIVGFSLIGIGYSNIVPIVFSRAAKIKGMSPSKGIAAVASVGYVGFLIGPVIIGFLSEKYGLNLAFGLMLILTSTALVFIKKSTQNE